MAKINLKIELNKNDERNLIESIQNYILSYNMLSRFNDKLPPMVSEICDNGNGTIELRILNFIFNVKEIIPLMDEVAGDMLKSMGIDIENIPKYI